MSSTTTNPLHNANRMKLGVMAFNCSLGSTVTKDPAAWELNWPNNVALATMADAAGFEALLPVGRWRGYRGETNFNGSSYESFTWAAGIAAVTRQIAILATVHAPLVHPVTAAKQAATVDHISCGRFVMNIVCGWNKPEFDMFGVQWRGHEQRYEYAAEWIGLIQRLWTESEGFDFSGRFFSGTDLRSDPKPIQSPVPLMNAGSSPTGQAFSARHSDMNFVMLRQKSDDADRAQITHLKQMARDNGRTSQCWIHAYVVCRDTEAEARLVLKRYVRDNGDWETAAHMVEMFGMQSGTLDADVLEAFKFHFIAGHGGYPLIGTPEQIVAQIECLSALGVDGMLLSWLDYLGECRHWIDHVLPLMEQAGLRAAFRAEA